MPVSQGKFMRKVVGFLEFVGVGVEVNAQSACRHNKFQREVGACLAIEHHLG
jgi:hypothetical protein